MLAHYLKVAARSLLADRFFTFVNLLGLSVGLAATTLIFLQVSHELAHDDWIPEPERLYRVDTNETHPGREPLEIARSPGPLFHALPREFAGVAGVARAYPVPASISRDGQTFREDLLVADPNFFSLVGLPLLAGSADRALSGTGAVAISRRAAEKYFGTADAVGRRLTLRTPAPRDHVVSAVFADLPENSHMAFDVVIPFDAYFGANSEEIRAIPDSWAGAYFFTYVRLKPGSDVADIEARLPGFTNRNVPDWLANAIRSAPSEFYRFRFVPVREVHFEGGAVEAMKPPGSRKTLAALSAVAAVILAIALLNFANLASARSTLRAREVALRKVLGASRRQIFAQFFGEAALMTVLAGLLGLAMVELALPYLAGLFGIHPDWPAVGEWRLYAALALALAVTLIASGFHPAMLVSRIRPAIVLATGTAQLKGGRVRNLLVVGQFAASIALIAVTIAMALQMNFARSVDLGFDPDNLLIVRLPESADAAAIARSFRDSASRLPTVDGASLSSSVPGDESEDNISVRIAGEEKPVQVGFHRVDRNFFGTYGVEPLFGRTSSMMQTDALQPGETRARPAVINRAAVERLALGSPEQAVGRQLRTDSALFDIVGVVPDFHFRSLHEPVRDEIYVLDDEPGRLLSIRFSGRDLPRFLLAVDRLWVERLPGLAVERQFMDDALAELYGEEARQTRLMIIFSAVAILLSSLGLLAMAAFSVQRRTREIAIRKVLGARTIDILRLLIWQFSRPVLIANIIAWPIAWIVVRRWLDGFHYRIDMPLTAFAAAGVGALLIAVIAVAGHAVKVARSNPVAFLHHD